MINIYLDTSGSMTEIGKDSALLYIAKSIEDYYSFQSIESTFLKLNGEIIKNLTTIEYSNNINLDMQNIRANSILLSDGLFNIDKDDIFDIAISVGVDSNISNLKKVSSKLFLNDNILDALEYLMFQNNLLNSSSNEEEDDEW